VLDREIVCSNRGRLNYSALLGRLGGAPTTAANLVVFDLLADAGETCAAWHCVHVGGS
jgi:ATP-dependent DNA ligase